MLAFLVGCGSVASQRENAEGVRLYQQARYSEALRHFQEATYIDPSNPDAYYNLASTYHRIGAAAGRMGELEKAEKYYNMCLDYDPNHEHVACYRGLARLLAEQGRRDEAMRLLEGWGDLRPELADAKIELARIHEELGDNLMAKEHLSEALVLDPRNARALTAMGKIREDMGEVDEALRNYQRSLASDHSQPQVAARVAALRSATSGQRPVLNSGSSATRLVDRPTRRLR